MTDPSDKPESPRVLVTEDDTLIAMMIEEMLQDLGCEVVGPLARLDDALEVARKETFEAALLDVNLQSKLVYPVADVLTDRGVRFAFMTGYGEATHPAEYRNYPNLSKPYEADDVRRILDQILPARG